MLDTLVFLWWCAGDPRLPDVERQAIKDGANDVVLRAASVWEMAREIEPWLDFGARLEGQGLRFSVPVSTI